MLRVMLCQVFLLGWTMSVCTAVFATDDTCSTKPGFDCSGGDLSHQGDISDASACCALCSKTSGCKGFTFRWNTCYFKTGCSATTGCSDCVAGTVSSPPPAPPSPQEPLSWDDAYTLAKAMLAKMTRSEKNLLIKAYQPNAQLAYVGNIPPVGRLGIPSLNMNDAGQGFRVQDKESIGTATSWLSGLAMGATWNPEIVRRVGVALGEEFRSKGANVILGPGLEVMRVARDGRGFEYISGDDPVLGAKLGAKYVEGVQSMGVMAVLKHLALHHQQENNKKESSNIDAKTLWELYYPPFAAGIEAGAVSVMSAYSKVNETWAAENSALLRTDLKGNIGFKGFVMSDWGGFNGEELAWHNGCDMDMTASFTQIGKNADPTKVGDTDIDDSVLRILAAMYKIHAFNSSTSCTPPGCDSFLRANVTEGHAEIAKAAAIESIVLLKNEGDVLPISHSVKKIAVVGPAADAPGIITIDYPGYPFPGDYYAGGGSGHVQTDRVVTPLQGIMAAAKARGIEVLVSASKDIEAAKNVARDADVTIVSVGTSSTEDVDRASLDLDDSANDFVAAVAQEARATVVIVQSPGPFLSPWRDEVQAIAALFLGGQETGNAWGAVLFGQEAPSGRLPVMLPATKKDQIVPSSSLSIDYVEHMHTSYRSATLKAAFPFGHGLTYTTFNYSNAKWSHCESNEADVCVTFLVTNSGTAAAQAVPQLYLEFPKDASEPAPLLKDFQKTNTLAAGASAEVTLRLTIRDRSYWDASSGWTLATTDSLVAHVGASSSDIRLSLALKPGGPVII